MGQAVRQDKVLLYSEDPAISTGLRTLLPEDCRLLEADHAGTLESALGEGPFALVLVTLPVTDPATVLPMLSERSGISPLIAIVSTTPSLDLINTLLQLRPEAVIGSPFDPTEATQTIYNVLKENKPEPSEMLGPIPNPRQIASIRDIAQLRELDRQRSELVMQVAHDLRTPLTAIRGYIELLERAGPLTEMQRDFIGRSLKSLRHITELISELLDVGRIETAYQLEMQPLLLDSLLREAAEAHRVETVGQGLAVTMELPDTPIWILGNRKWMQQVVDRLITNAIKYNHPGGWIRTTAEHDGQYITVTVEDSGSGIPADEQHRVFDHFYRVQSPGSENEMGTGLGLALVKSIIEKHKGRIWVNSTPGLGSAFTFIIPEHAMHSEAQGVRSKESTQSFGPKRSPKPATD